MPLLVGEVPPQRRRGFKRMVKIMTYTQALEYIHSTLKFGSKPGLECIGRLLELMGNPQDSLRFVHVAGTSGKGSTSAATAAVLKTAGYKTGLYISPYIEDFCERIQVNGEMISHDELAAAVEAIIPFAQSIGELYEHPTEFEIITALAFDYFKKTKCDVVVLEVGLGGRLDATNIIKTPLVSVITSISYDHVEILGNTLEKIAYEKCGIIKRGSVTVSSPSQDTGALSVIMESCARCENTLIIPNLSSVNILSEGIEGTSIVYGQIKLFIPLCGRHQINNFLTAYEVLVALRERFYFNITNEIITSGMAAVHFPARIEVLNNSPLVIVDGAHNPAKLSALAQTINRFIKCRKITVIMGILSDKDIETSIALIAPYANNFIALEPESPRALAATKTAKVAMLYCKNVVVGQNYTQALEKALEAAGNDGAVIICGSFYLAGPMRKLALEKFKNRQKTS